MTDKFLYKSDLEFTYKKKGGGGKGNSHVWSSKAGYSAKYQIDNRVLSLLWADLLEPKDWNLPLGKNF